MTADNSSRRLSLILGAILVAMLARFTWDSATEIIEINDFEVFYYVAEAIQDGAPVVYSFRSPGKDREFLYPPSSAILLTPLTWLPFNAMAVVFSIVKVACLLVLVLGAIRFSGAPPPDRAGDLLLALATLVVMYRSVDTDMGNGQVNFIVGLLGVGGIWMCMARTRWGSLGGVLLGLAVALKLTPILLASLLLVHRRWTALGVTLVTVVLLMMVMPAVHFGADASRELSREHRELMATYLMDSKDRDRQVTFNEIIHFTIAHWRADPEGLVIEDGRLHRASDGELVILPDTMSIGAARALWFGIGLATGVFFLFARRRFFGGDWTWDLAMLCTLMICLSPRVRKAHLVILIVPTAWLACRVYWLLARSTWRAHRGWLAVLACAVLAFFISEDLPVPAPGFPMPYRAGLLVGLLLLIGALTVAARPAFAADCAPLPTAPPGTD